MCIIDNKPTYIVNAEVTPVEIAPQLQHYRHVTFDINYEDTTNAEEYLCQDNTIQQGNDKVTHSYMYLIFHY